MVEPGSYPEFLPGAREKGAGGGPAEDAVISEPAQADGRAGVGPSPAASPALASARRSNGSTSPNTNPGATMFVRSPHHSEGLRAGTPSGAGPWGGA